MLDTIRLILKDMIRDNFKNQEFWKQSAIDYERNKQDLVLYDDCLKFAEIYEAKSNALIDLDILIEKMLNPDSNS